MPRSCRNQSSAKPGSRWLCSQNSSHSSRPSDSQPISKRAKSSGPRWPFADRKHGSFLERCDSRSHSLHRRRRDVEIDGVSTYPVVSDRMPSHHQARQTGVLKGRHDLGHTGLDTQWIESSHGRLPCARRSLTSSWRPNSSSVSRWASSAISARCASRTMLSASAVELARPDKRGLDLGFHGTRGGCDRLVAPARHRWGSLWATSWKVALGPHRCGRSVHVDSTVTEIPPFVKNWQGRP